MNRLLLPFAVFLVAASGSRSMAVAPAGDDEAKAITALERAMNQAKDPGGSVLQVIDDLRKFDSPAVAEVLVKAFTQLEVDAQKTDGQAHADIEKGKLSPGEVISRRAAIDPLRKAQAELLDRVSLLRSEATLAWLIDHVIGDEKCSASLKIECVKAAAASGKGAVEPLQRALARMKKPDDAMAVLTACEQLGPAARPLADALIPLLDHKDATVREAAAMALSKVAVPQSIEPLIRRIALETGRTQLKMVIALEILTKQKHGLGVQAWQSWFAAEGIRYTSGQAEVGGGTSTVTAQAAGYFHEIPQDSRSICYVVDVSGSMVVSLTDPKFEGPDNNPKPIPAAPGEASRMSCSKTELVKALGQLPPGTLFNIVIFSTKAERYSPKLVTADEASIKKAQKWVEALEPNGATNIYDAMELAFGLAGRGAQDKYYDSGIDTIFLLTDGEPFLPNGKDSTERILQAVRRMNPYKRITVHTIGLGKKIDADFLRKMATDNNGVFKQE